MLLIDVQEFRFFSSVCLMCSRSSSVGWSSLLLDQESQIVPHVVLMETLGGPNFIYFWTAYAMLFSDVISVSSNLRLCKR